ncbi:MAG: butyrate kinase [Candidatus Eiseniibacteriota bacterium]|nr:MAG: butyrate kinase [Candidatus Eisenbacteria bacterium]
MGMKKEVVLVINPGSTSTKLAIYSREGSVFETNVKHDASELAKFDLVTEQLDLRWEVISECLKENLPGSVKVVGVVGRGGPLRPLEEGTYRVSPTMLEELRTCRHANHVSNLGAIIADRFSEQFGVPAFIVDPVTVDNLIPEARISGHPLIERTSLCHALNIRSTAAALAEQLGRPLTELNLVVAHLGGGISVCALKKGRLSDLNNALLAAGPFTPNRAGTLPIGPLVKLCFSGKYDEKELLNILSKESGLKAYLGTADVEEVLRRIEAGDERARLVFGAMVYQIAKEIGAMAAAMKGQVDGIILTGGMTHSGKLTDWITEYVAFLGPVHVFPGERELQALAEGAFRVLDGKEEAKEY